jgi:hypothetical protein
MWPHLGRSATNIPQVGVRTRREQGEWLRRFWSMPQFTTPHFTAVAIMFQLSLEKGNREPLIGG